MPLIQVCLLGGRTPQTKAELMRALTDAAVLTLEAPRETVRVILHEVPPEHWAVGGVPKARPPQEPSHD